MNLGQYTSNGPLFLSAHLKVERAKYLLSELKDTLRFLTKSNLHCIKCDIEPDTQKYGLRLEFHDDHSPQCSVVIGEIYHNLRSALDHIAVALETKTPKPRAAKYIKFPFHKTQKNFIDELEKWSVYRSFPVVGSVIRSTLKCYEEGNRPLWLVSQMNNIDKHRALAASVLAVSVEGVCASDEWGGAIINQSFAVYGSGYCGGFSSPAKITITNYGRAKYDLHFNERDLVVAGPAIPILTEAISRVDEAASLIEDAFNLDTSQKKTGI